MGVRVLNQLNAMYTLVIADSNPGWKGKKDYRAFKNLDIFQKNGHAQMTPFNQTAERAKSAPAPGA